MWQEVMKKVVRWADPKLEKFRERKPTPKYAPKSLEEFIGVIQRTPKEILSMRDRARIAAVMEFENKTARDIMVPKSKMVFVKKDEMLGPLTLDKLYQSGFTEFPVVDSKEKVVGIVSTEALNKLEVRNLEKAEKYMDRNVYYTHEKDSLKHITGEFLRTNVRFLLILDGEEKLAGFVTLDMLFKFLEI